MNAQDEIFLVEKDDVSSLPSIQISAGLFGEKLEPALQSLLQNHPELIPGKQIDPDSDDPPRFVLLRREMPVSGMSLDHLFVDQYGVLTLVEAKLFQNPESRRDVIGQIIEYAANAFDLWASGAVRQYATEYWGKQGYELDEVLANRYGEEFDAEDFWNKVEQNLRYGRIRLIIAADQLRPEVRRMIEYLNSEMQNAEILGLELKCYGNNDHSVVMVPRVSGRTEQSSRQKTVYKTLNRQTTQEEMIAKLTAEALPVFRRIIEYATDFELILYWGTKGFSLRMPNALGKPITVLYGYPPGSSGREFPFIQLTGKYTKESTIGAEIVNKLLLLPKTRSFGDQGVDIEVVGEGVDSAHSAIDLALSFKEKIAKMV